MLHVLVHAEFPRSGFHSLHFIVRLYFFLCVSYTCRLEITCQQCNWRKHIRKAGLPALHCIVLSSIVLFQYRGLVVSIVRFCPVPNQMISCLVISHLLMYLNVLHCVRSHSFVKHILLYHVLYHIVSCFIILLSHVVSDRIFLLTKSQQIWPTCVVFYQNTSGHAVYL